MMKYPLLLVFCVFLFSVHAFAQSWGYLGIENGLSNNTVNAVFKDKVGFMWFATDDGLNQYDGYEFKVYRNRINDTTSLIHNQINTVTEDKFGNLWVGTKRGLSTFNSSTSRFSPAFYYSSKQTEPKKLVADVTDIALDREGNLYVATVSLGLLVSNKSNKAFTQIALKSVPAAYKPYSVGAIHIYSQGKVWVMVQDVGLHLYDASSGELTLISNNIKNANVIKAESENTLWIGTDNGLYRQDFALKANRLYSAGIDKLCNSRVVDINTTEKGKVWIATDGGGVNILDLKTNKISSIQSGEGNMHLTSNAVTSLFKDNESRWWIGTQRGGINIIDKQKDRFTTIRRDLLNKNTLVNNFILSFCEDADKTVWIGTDGGGVSLWNRKDNTYQNFVHEESDPTSLSNNNATSILRDDKNNIWIATWGGGINRYNRSTGTFKRYDCGPDKYIWKLYEDSENNLWAGTTESGPLYRYNSALDKFEVYDSSLKNAISILEDQEGILWLGTYNEVIRVNKQTRQYKRFTINYPVRDLYQDKSGNLWAGTQGLGLLKIDRQTGRFKAFTEAEGLSNNSVHNIEEDKHGNLWISTYHGISKLDNKTSEFKNFYEADGLQSNQYNYNASLSLSTGELLFGGIKGFNIFNPDSIKTESAFPELVITGMRIFNKPVTSADNILKQGQSPNQIKELVLPYNKTFISFDFSALEYTSPNNIKYAYFLEGWDNAWNYSDKVRTANYSRLEEGGYTLRIKSTNAAGTWNDQERIIHINVLPPWYRTWWAYCLYAGCVAAILYLYNLYKSKQARLKYEVEIAKIKAEQEAVLNEKKISFFTNISHEFRTPLTLIINPIKDLLDKKKEAFAYQDLQVTYRNARKLLGLVDQLLLFRKAESGRDVLKAQVLNIAQVCEETYLSFSHQAKVRDIHYTFECPDKSLQLYGDREKLEIVLFNLLSNAFKFTPKSGEVMLSVREVEGQVEIKIKDSGCGIPADTGEKLFEKFHQVYNPGASAKSGFGIGLYLVKKFVEGHDGKITYESELGKGTLFRIMMPKAEQHLPEENSTSNIDDSESSAYLEELLENMKHEEPVPVNEPCAKTNLGELVMEKGTMLLVEDNDQIRQYLKQLFKDTFNVVEADNGTTGFELAQEYVPDIIISDIMMQGMSGLELCSKIKENVSLNHIPVILLTASSSPEAKLQGVEGGADDYITKPFEKELLVARVNGLLKSRDNLQRYFYNEVTLKTNNLQISAEYSDFLTTCIEVIEGNLDDSNFNIKSFALEMGMSHSNLYKRIKSISGRSINDFVRFIRLRKVAKLLIDTDCKVNEAASQAGFNDIKYFRAQFQKLFGMNPSEYIKKYRKPFAKKYSLNEQVLKEVVE